MISFYVNFIKPLVRGEVLQWYAVILFIALVGIFSYEIICTIGKKERHTLYHKLFHLFTLFLLFLFVAVTLTLAVPTPNLTSPALPLFEPLSISSENPLRLTFDRPISKKISATIAPQVQGTWKLGTSPFRLPVNQLSFYPSEPLQSDTEYSVEIKNIAPLTDLNSKGDKTLLFVFKTSPASPDGEASGGRGTTTGTDSLKQQVFAAEETSPTPRPEADQPLAEKTFVLNVPQFKQHHTFTCFSVAAKMALGYRNVTVDELGFLDEIGYDQTERNFVSNTWGDPNKAVVGTFDGSGPGGYGVHWEPVATTIGKHRKTEVKRNWNIPEMLQKVEEGNPVMVWWVNGVWPAKDVSWNLPAGGKVYTVNGMHVEVVVGWTGERDNPQYILTNDPWRGRRQYTPERFLSLWKWFSNTAVVVY